jgi:hypothetical protein
LRASTPSSTSIQFLHKWLTIVIISSYSDFSIYQMKNIWTYEVSIYQARGCAGRTAAPTEMIGVAEVLRVPSDSCSAKQEKQHYKYKISAEPPLHGEVSKTCKKEVGSMPDNTYKARWPHIHNSGLKKFRVQLLASHLQVITNSGLCSCTQYMRARQKYHIHLVNYPAWC